MIVSTTNFVAGMRVVETKGQTFGVVVRSRGLAGNIAAGKYNDGSAAARTVLTKRMHDGLVAAETNLTRVPVKTWTWHAEDFLPPPRSSLRADDLTRQVADKAGSVPDRVRAAYRLAWLRRLEQKIPITLSCLHVGGARLLHLPGEAFIEYQLRAQQLSPNGFVCTAAYGDGGPWYIPVKEEYPREGYEVSVAFCAPAIDDLLTAGIRRVLSA